MACFPRMHNNKNGGPLAKEWLRHLPQTQSYESFRTPKRLSKTPASGDFVSAVMTVEAALSFSLFLLLISLFFTFYQEQRIALKAQKALDETAQAVAEWSYAVQFAEGYTGTDILSLADGSKISSVLEGSSSVTELLNGQADLLQEIKVFLAEKGSALLWQALLKQIVARKIGEQNLKNAGVAGGAGGLSLSGSTLHDRQLNLVLRFTVCSRIGAPFGLKIPVTVRSLRRLWIGTVSVIPQEGHPEEEDETETEETIVYVTANGEVFHRTKQCRILHIRPFAVSAAEVGTYRNNSGGKYYPCDYCCGGKAVREGLVYITDEGIRYHADRTCFEITRTVREIALSEAQEKYRPCYYCGQEAG